MNLGWAYSKAPVITLAGVSKGHLRAACEVIHEAHENLEMLLREAISLSTWNLAYLRTRYLLCRELCL